MTVRVAHVVLSVDDASGGPGALLAEMLPLGPGADQDAVVLAVQDQPSALADRMAPYAELSTTLHGRWLGRMHTSARLLLRIWRATDAADVVVAHSFFNLPGLVAAAGCRRHRTALVVAPHGCLDPYDVRKHGSTKQRLAPLWRWMLQHATVWCITDREAAELVTFGASPRIVVVPPPIEVPELTDPAVALARVTAMSTRVVDAVGRGGSVVSFVGRFAAKKGLPRLVAAFDEAAGDDDVLVLAGAADYDGAGGDPAPGIARMRRREQVVLPGWIDPATRSALWSLPGIFALPSDDENFGMAVAEAMACGVPVVVSRHVALADLVEAADAGVVTSTDPLDVAAGLRKLLQDAVTRRSCGAAARAAVAEHLSAEAVGGRWAALFDVARADTRGGGR